MASDQYINASVHEHKSRHWNNVEEDTGVSIGAQQPSYEEVRKHCDVLNETLEILEQRYVDLQNAHRHLRKTNSLLVERLLAAQVKSNIDKAKERENRNSSESPQSKNKSSRSPSRVRIADEEEGSQKPPARGRELSSSSSSKIRGSDATTISLAESAMQQADDDGFGFPEIVKLRNEVAAWWSDLRSQEVANGKEILGIRQEVAAQADQLRRIVSLLRRGLKYSKSDSNALSDSSSVLFMQTGYTLPSDAKAPLEVQAVQVAQAPLEAQAPPVLQESTVASDENSIGGSFQAGWMAKVPLQQLKNPSLPPASCNKQINMIQPALQGSANSFGKGEANKMSKSWAPGQILCEGRCLPASVHNARDVIHYQNVSKDVHLRPNPTEGWGNANAQLRSRSPLPSYDGCAVRSVSPISGMQVIRSRSVSPAPSRLINPTPSVQVVQRTLSPAPPQTSKIVACSLAAQARKIVTVTR